MLVDVFVLFPMFIHKFHRFPHFASDLIAFASDLIAFVFIVDPLVYVALLAVGT